MTSFFCTDKILVGAVMSNFATFSKLFLFVLFGSVISNPVQPCIQISTSVWDCSNRELTQLPEDLDINVSELDLSHNKIKHFPSNFKDGFKVIRLKLSYNLIEILNHDAFHNLKFLESLDLSHNFFKHWNDVRSSAFEYLRRIKKMDFSHNKFSFVDVKDIQSLEVLKLENCSLGTITNIINPNNDLKELFVSNNNIKKISENLTSSNLKYLDLTNIQLTEILETAFDGLNGLGTLLLRDNKNMKSLNVNDCWVINLDVSNCSLESFPKGKFHKLKNLNLANNILKEITSDILKNFTTNQTINLNLSQNYIGKIDGNVFSNISCRKIDLSRNLLSYLDREMFRKNSELEYLDVSYNRILKIEIMELLHLKIFNVSHNFLEVFPDLPSIEKIDISNTSIMNLNPKLFQNNQNLILINGSSNTECYKWRKLFQENCSKINVICDETSEKLKTEDCLNKKNQNLPQQSNASLIICGVLISILTLLSPIAIIVIREYKKKNTSQVFPEEIPLQSKKHEDSVSEEKEKTPLSSIKIIRSKSVPEIQIKKKKITKSLPTVFPSLNKLFDRKDLEPLDTDSDE